MTKQRPFAMTSWLNGTKIQAMLTGCAIHKDHVPSCTTLEAVAECMEAVQVELAEKAAAGDDMDKRDEAATKRRNRLNAFREKHECQRCAAQKVKRPKRDRVRRGASAGGTGGKRVRRPRGVSIHANVGAFDEDGAEDCADVCDDSSGSGSGGGYNFGGYNFSGGYNFGGGFGDGDGGGGVNYSLNIGEEALSNLVHVSAPAPASAIARVASAAAAAAAAASSSFDLDGMSALFGGDVDDVGSLSFRDDAGIVPSTVMTEEDVDALVSAKAQELMHELEKTKCADAAAVAVIVAVYSSQAFKSVEGFHADMAVWSHILLRAPYRSNVRSVIHAVVASAPGDGAVASDAKKHSMMAADIMRKCLLMCAWLDAMPSCVDSGVSEVVFAPLLQNFATV
jgi:hypothetical protein